jgi:hypothetical protein
MKLENALAILPALLFAACSSATPEAHDAATHDEQGEHHGDGDHDEHDEHAGDGDHHDHHPPMDADLHAFHEVLAPVFHMDKGAARADKACAGAAAMKEAAGKVAASRTNDGAKGKATELVTQVDALAAACAGADKSAVEAKLDEVHGAFHATMEAH